MHGRRTVKRAKLTLIHSLLLDRHVRCGHARCVHALVTHMYIALRGAVDCKVRKMLPVERRIGTAQVEEDRS
jgi:hypothetical protein